ncbi:MerR family transcriptional regulator [Tyzzerella sp. OttesenSCG-928-J15]|nr:MerR family transcriptional regulator [Ruminococcaceae bacterium OttesenSCG-928-L11]MDL2248708.1 MerR family transcriptional regulator [Tyzzerella sp. OttesenSCG-928-J15]
MLKISEFSHLVRISPRMLRHYEKCGLLHPAEIDKFTGYRQYSAGQIPLAQNIVLLRDLGFSIDEIGDALPRIGDFAYMSKILRAKADSVQSVIEAEQIKLDRLLGMSDTMRKERNILIYEVELKKLPAVKVLSLRGIIPKYNQEGILWERLGRYIGENRIYCHSDGYSTYFDEEYKETDPDVEIAIPVDTLGESSGDFIYKEYPEITLAATLRFTGPFDGGYDAASEKLAHWMEDNGYGFAGPLRGHVITSPDDTDDPEKLETEIQAPVAKL